MKVKRKDAREELRKGFQGFLLCSFSYVVVAEREKVGQSDNIEEVEIETVES